MKNNKFIKSTIILIIGGFITKILGFIIRIVYTRLAKEEAISLYTIITPTYSLFISITAAFLPVTISKLVSENKYNNQTLLFNAFLIIAALNILIIFIGLSTSNIVAIKLLKEPRVLPLFKTVLLTLPFVSLSSIFKGYYLGKQKMHPNIISNIIEQIVRLILIIILVPKVIYKGPTFCVCLLISMSIITEIISCLVFILFLPKGNLLNKKNFKISPLYIKKILKISIPLTSSRLIGNIGFFFEPILLTNILLANGFSHKYILSNYGIYNAYAISLLALPNFFIMAISSAIIPEISRYYSKNNIKMVQKRFKQALYISLILGIVFSTFIMIFRNNLLMILYKTTKGSSFIKILGPAFALFYLEGPLTSTLQAIGKTKKTLYITIIGIIIKLVSISLFATFKLGIYSLIIAEIINIFSIVIISLYAIKKELF